MMFLEGISDTRKAELLKQLRAVWTHDSTAIEGNTLSLRDTMFVLEYGLTVKGKPLKDQIDICNHARAVDCVFDIFAQGHLSETDIFHLHRLLINEQSSDIYKPVGAYKRENNGTYRIGRDGRSEYHAYLAADEVPAAMAKFLADFNGLFRKDADDEYLINAYATAHADFTEIHPFFDGNGRIARLIANLPILYAGRPPIVIPMEKREDYIKVLQSAETGNRALFENFVRDCWKVTRDLVDAARR